MIEALLSISYIEGVNKTGNKDITNIGISILKAKGMYGPDKK